MKIRAWGTYSVHNKVLFIFPDWEERAYYGFLEDINTVQFNKVVLINYIDGLHSTKTASVIEQIISTSISNNIELFKLDLQKNDFVHNWNIVAEFVLKQGGKLDEIYIDITTMPREVVWILLYNWRKKVSSVGYFYHKPLSYNNEWLTREPEVPRLLLKHSGVIDPFKQTALLIITGFDWERVNQINNFFEPKKVILGIQSGSQFDNHVRNKNELFSLETECASFEIDAYANDNGFSVIQNQVCSVLAEFNLVIASLGPKLTALSMYRLYVSHPEIALCYIPCKDFNVEYSEGISETIIGKIDL